MLLSWEAKRINGPCFLPSGRRFGPCFWSRVEASPASRPSVTRVASCFTTSSTLRACQAVAAAGLGVDAASMSVSPVVRTRLGDAVGASSRYLATRNLPLFRRGDQAARGELADDELGEPRRFGGHRCGVHRLGSRRPDGLMVSRFEQRRLDVGYLELPDIGYRVPGRPPRRRPGAS